MLQGRGNRPSIPEGIDLLFPLLQGMQYTHLNAFFWSSDRSCLLGATRTKSRRSVCLSFVRA